MLCGYIARFFAKHLKNLRLEGPLFASVRLEKMIELITDSSEGSVITRKGIMVNLEEFSLVTADRSQRMIRRDLR